MSTSNNSEKDASLLQSNRTSTGIRTTVPLATEITQTVTVAHSSVRTQVRTLWSHFRRWRRTRPFWGGILLILAGLLVLWAPINLLQFALLPGSNIWAELLVGALLLVMGLIQLLSPSYALITGAVGIVLSLISLIVALGGLGIGMILGIIGGALGVAWRQPGRKR